MNFFFPAVSIKSTFFFYLKLIPSKKKSRKVLTSFISCGFEYNCQPCLYVTDLGLLQFQYLISLKSLFLVHFSWKSAKHTGEINSSSSTELLLTINKYPSRENTGKIVNRCTTSKLQCFLWYVYSTGMQWIFTYIIEKLNKSF